MSNPQTAAEFWGAPIVVYTREEALEDGVLVTASTGDLAEVSLQHFGANANVAMTSALFELIDKAVKNPRAYGDWKGIWHDVCWMSKMWVVKKIQDEYALTVWFVVTIVGAGRQKKYTLKRVIQPDGNGGVEVTFMMQNED